MKISRWFAILVFAGAILAFVGLSPSTALADGITDPGVRLCCDTSGTGLFTPNDPNFNFTVFGGGQNAPPTTTDTLFASFDFINATGQNAIGLNLAIDSTNAPGLIFTCEGEFAGGPYFTDCTVIQSGNTALIEFSGLNTGEGGFGGIPAATDLTNVSQCSDGPQFCSTQTPGAGFIVQIYDHNNDLINLPTTEFFKAQGTLLVPEPSTVLLLTAGLLFLFLVRGAGWVPKLT